MQVIFVLALQGTWRSRKDLASKGRKKVERKVCLEKEDRHVYGHISRLGGNETTKEGATRWAPSGKARENDPETQLKEGQPWMLVETGGREAWRQRKEG